MVTGFDKSKLGTQILTVTYKGKTTTYTIEINKKPVSKIEIEVFPTKTIYIQNYEKLDVTGGKIKATYDDTTTKVIDIAEEMVSGFDNTKVGKQTLTVTYGGKTATYEVQINVKQIIKIEIEKNPTKVEYIQNYEKLDVTGGKIKITYDDTSTEVILLTEEMVTGFDNTKLGKQILTVTYGKKMVTYEVRINEKQVDKIEIEKNPIKNVYIQNYEKLDVTGGKIKVTYNDTTTETIEMTEKMVSGFDNKKLGRQTLTVTYEGKNTTYEIQISAKKIVKVEIQTKPTKVEYIQNYEKLDVTGGKIKVTYDDTTTETIDIAVGMVSGFDNMKVGKQTLTITYGEKVVTYEIEVKTKKISKIEIETKPTKTEYIQNYEKLDITGGKIKVVYNDTTTEIVALTEEMVSGFDNTKVGKQKINVKYRGMSTILEVNIVAKKINKIEMETNPTKTTYVQNTEKLDVAGGKIKVEYNDTTTETIVLTEEMVKGFDNTKIGAQTLTVSYKGFNTSYKVTVVEKTIKKDEINNQEENKTEPKENNTIKNENKNQTQNETVNKNKLISVLPKTGKGKSIILIMMILTITFSGYQILKLKKNRDIK